MPTSPLTAGNTSPLTNNPASLPEAGRPIETDLPTNPGCYWFQHDAKSRAIMLEVRMTNGTLTVWWPNKDQPIANLNGHWRGPIPPSSGQGSR